MDVSYLLDESLSPLPTTPEYWREDAPPQPISPPPLFVPPVSSEPVREPVKPYRHERKPYHRPSYRRRQPAYRRPAYRRPYRHRKSCPPKEIPPVLSRHPPAKIVNREPELLLPTGPWIPPEARKLVVSGGDMQVHFHPKCMAVLCIRDNGFTLTNGFMTFSMDNASDLHDKVMECVLKMQVGRLCFTDRVTKLRWKMMTLDDSTIRTFMMETNFDAIGTCPFCKLDRCHRYLAVVGGISKVLQYPIELIPH